MIRSNFSSYLQNTATGRTYSTHSKHERQTCVPCMQMVSNPPFQHSDFYRYTPFTARPPDRNRNNGRAPSFRLSLRVLNNLIFKPTFIETLKSPHLSLEASRSQPASSEAAASDVTATILLLVSPVRKLHDVFGRACFIFWSEHSLY